jgi:type II secretory pathway pseudopilin PulG
VKSLIQAVAVAAALVVPVASFAQSNSTVTRAQVRAEIVQLAQVGYRVGYADNVHYPENIQAAEARVAALKSNSGYGGVANGTSEAGGSAAVPAAAQ